MGLGNLSGGEILILMLIILLVFGANRLPEAGKAVGKGLREFKRALSEAENSIRQLPPSASREGEQLRDPKPKRLVE
jgi:sec-independent protein translocase protein TatA